MNNNLKILSERELDQKRDIIHSSSSFLKEKESKIYKIYNRISGAWLTSPSRLLRLQREIKSYRDSIDLLDEYANTILDEKNRRIS